MNITYTTKEMSQNDETIIKPKLFAIDKSHPYYLLDPLQFEDITYFTIKQVIDAKKLWYDFDEIELMGGVRDFGQDCVLKTNNITRGIIQCKHSRIHSKTNIGIVARDIIKYLLYSIKNPELIPDISNFTYYFFASEGLSKPALELIEDFNTNILGHSQLELWVNTVIKNYSSVRDLGSYVKIKDVIDNKLSILDVKRLPVKDFDMLLVHEFNQNIISKFFAVRILVEKNSQRNTLTSTQAKEYIRSASLSFSEIPNYFGNNIESHINRAETNDIYNWVFEDLPASKSNVAVLDANAGLGKTIVLRDLYEKLYLDDIPALVLKADKYFASDLVGLESKIFQKADIHISTILDKLIEEHEKIVVIIDQLDALSQTLSTKRDFLITYNRLISDLSHRRNIRVVVSVRSFDLKYDSELSKYNSIEFKKVKLKLLSKEEVKSVLSKINITNAPDKLIELLRTPNHLNIFCKLNHEKKYKLDTLQSLKDLYDELWKDIVIRKTNKFSKTNKTLLNLIVGKMSVSQKMVTYNQFKDEYYQELTFLKSEGLIIEESNRIQLFHQTFYDYIFAKQFVEQGKSLIKYVKKEEQSLYVRQIIKMVIEYLRESNKKIYIDTISTLLKSRRSRFHIKMLIITSLGVVKSPIREEVKLVKNYILKRSKFYSVFLESVVSKGWLDILLEEDLPLDYLNIKESWRHKILDSMNKKIKRNRPLFNIESYEDEKNNKYNLIIWLIRNNIAQDTNNIIDLLMHVADTTSNKDFVMAILYFYEFWEDERLYTLFEKHYSYKPEDKNDNFRYFKILKDIIEYKPEYVLTKLKPHIIQIFHHGAEDFIPSVDFEHSIEDIIESIGKIDSELIFNFLWEITNKLSKIHKKNKEDTDLYDSHYFCDYVFKSAHGRDADEFIFRQMDQYIMQKMTLDKAKQILHKNRETRLIPILHLKAKILNRFFRELIDNAYELIVFVGNHNGYNGLDRSFSNEMRILIGKCFSDMQIKQKAKVVDILLSIKPRKGGVYQNRGEESRTIFKPYYKKQYLFISEIPEAERKVYSKLHRRYNELLRLYGKAEAGPLDVSTVTVRRVPSPLNSDTCSLMSNKDWVRTMKKYDSEYRADFFNDNGGMQHHADSFKKEVAKRTKVFVPFIFDLLSKGEVDLKYIVSGLEGLIEGNHSPLLVMSLYKAVIKLNLNDNLLFYLLSTTDYLISTEVIDKEIIRILSELVTSYSDKKEDYNDPHISSINTVRGKALEYIIRSSKLRNADEEIFSTVERAVSYDLDYLNTVIISHVAFLNSISVDRAFNIFIDLTTRVDLKVLKYSVPHSNYYIRKYHARMEPYFYRLLESEELGQDGAILIMKCWMLNLENSERLLSKLKIRIDEKNVFIGILRVAEGNFIVDGIVNLKSIELMTLLLEVDNMELSERYSGFILRKFKAERFHELIAFVTKYSNSIHVANYPAYFFKFLLECSSQFPNECLTLLKKTIPYTRPSIQHSSYFDKEPIQIILAIYSSLSKDFISNKKAIREALDVFDEMLQIKHLRTSATQALNSLNVESKIN